jgi:Zn-finger nucleic acid-binding protein
VEVAMINGLQRACAVALCALAVGCAAMSESQCRATNWYDQGEYDGLLGQQAKIDQYAYQCAKYQVRPAENDYLSGWAEGYAEYNKRVSGSKM